MVLDSGASLSLLTESAAARLGVTFVPGATAMAKGLHEADLPMRLGWVDSMRVGDLTLTDIPVGVLPDGTLTFELDRLLPRHDFHDAHVDVLPADRLVAMHGDGVGAGLQRLAALG